MSKRGDIREYLVRISNQRDGKWTSRHVLAYTAEDAAYQTQLAIDRNSPKETVVRVEPWPEVTEVKV